MLLFTVHVDQMASLQPWHISELFIHKVKLKHEPWKLLLLSCNRPICAELQLWCLEGNKSDKPKLNTTLWWCEFSLLSSRNQKKLNTRKSKITVKNWHHKVKRILQRKITAWTVFKLIFSSPLGNVYVKIAPCCCFLSHLLTYFSVEQG